MAAILWSCLALASGASANGAQEPAQTNVTRAGALDIIPRNAVAAVAINNVRELTVRGDALIEQTKIEVPLRFTDGYRLLLNFLGLKQGCDDQGAAALLVMKSTPIEEAFVLLVPVDDIEKMAGNFRIPRAELATGKAVDRTEYGGEAPIPYARYLAVRGKHLLLGGNRELVDLAATGAGLRDLLDRDEQVQLAADDLVVYFNATKAPAEWGGPFENVDRQMTGLAPDETAALQQLKLASKELQRVVAGLRLDQGVAATAVLTFDGDQSRQVLTRFQGGTGARVSLNGLPPGRILAAHSAAGDGEQSAAVARSLVKMVLQNFSLGNEPFLSIGHRPNVVGVFGEVWQQLQASRTALYQNERPDQNGVFSLMAILDTRDAGEFIREMTELSRFIRAATLTPEELADTIDDKTLEALIAQLGHSQYRVRQTATTKLALIGPIAFPALEKVLDARDAEVRERARYLHRYISATLKSEREEAIQGDLLAKLRPKFAFFPRAETRAGQAIDIVQMQLAVEEAPWASRLRRLLGPQWSKLRLASSEKQIAVLLGSSMELLDQTLVNLGDAGDGLPSGLRLERFQSRADPGRTAEFHLSITGVQQLIDPGTGDRPLDRGELPLTSVGITTAPQRIRCDLLAPVEEVRTAVQVARVRWR